MEFIPPDVSRLQQIVGEKFIGISTTEVQRAVTHRFKLRPGIPSGQALVLAKIATYPKHQAGILNQSG
jgi:hypothetical protein